MAAADIPMQMCKEMEPKSMTRPKQWSELVNYFVIFANEILLFRRGHIS